MINPETGHPYRPSDVYPGTTAEDFKKFIAFYRAMGYVIEIQGFRVPSEVIHENYFDLSPSRFNGQIWEGNTTDWDHHPRPTTPRIIYTIRTANAGD